MPDPLDRFAAKVEVTDSCWLWTATRHRKGYGQFQFDGSMRQAHRWLWEQTVGPIPEGLELDHLCRVRHCVNPDHLEPVTHAENVARAASPSAALRRHWDNWRAERPNCPKGHPYTEENTMTYPYKPRQCRTCNRERAAAWRARTQSEFID